MNRNAILFALFVSLLILFALGLPSYTVTNLERFHAEDGAMWSSFIITAEGDTTTIHTIDPDFTSESFDFELDEWVYPFTDADRRAIEDILNRHDLLWHRDDYQRLIPVHDGTTLAIDVTYDGKTKEIWCNNNIPGSLWAIPLEIIAYYEKTYPAVQPVLLDPTEPPRR